MFIQMVSTNKTNDNKTKRFFFKSIFCNLFILSIILIIKREEKDTEIYLQLQTIVMVTVTNYFERIFKNNKLFKKKKHIHIIILKIVQIKEFFFYHNSIILILCQM